MNNSGPCAPGSALAAIVTTFKPDSRFFQRFEPALALCASVIVVDNTPGRHDFGERPRGAAVQIFQDGQNKGLGPALNIGIAAAKRAGADSVILFDQDSTPSADFLRRMASLLDSAAGNVCFGPRHLDDALVTAQERDVNAAPSFEPLLDAVSCLPTSGMIFRIGGLEPDQLFSEELFLDFVDFDWCWRLRERGWQFYRASNVVMPHRLGLGQRRFLHLTYHVPAPYRHYFQFRDTLRLTLRPHVPLYSKLRLAGILPLKVLAYPFLMDRGWERLRWMARGTIDALRSVGGIGAARETLSR